jgi:hypothetical protein
MAYSLFAKQSKCEFAKSELVYLGHIISRDGVIADPTKIQAIIDWPAPENVTQVKGFNGHQSRVIFWKNVIVGTL